jgi:methylmalonyl-CoA mutase
MSDTDSSFPGLEAWRRLVETSVPGGLAALASHTPGGLAVEALYPARRDASVLTARTRPWRLVQILDHADPDQAARQAQEDLAGGATGLALRFDSSPLCAGTGLPATAAALSGVLEGIDLAAVALSLDPQPQPGLARQLAKLILDQGVAPERARVDFGLGPLAAPQPDGGDGAAAFRSLHDDGFRSGLASLDGRPVHEAGGSEAQELAAILASAAWWLRALDAAGVSAEAALPCFAASLSVDRDQFVSLAKLRALRLLWSRLCEVCGVASAPLPVHAETSRRMLTAADPHANLLRNTLAAFAAAVGGADSIAILPHTAALGEADAEARALARSLQHLLAEEAHLWRVADPGAGSGAIEALTDQLAEKAWDEFRSIEREGGIVASLAGGFCARIGAAREALRVELAAGRVPLVGSTVYPPPDEKPGRARPLPHRRHHRARPLPLVALEELAG